MSSIVIMVGLPASGKSTRAQELSKKSGNAVRINKDLIRTMLHFDKFTGKNEADTRFAARRLADDFLLDGKTVIIDDTNLNPGTLQSWKDLAKTRGAHIHYEHMKTPVEECIARDRKRIENGERGVGDHVIYGMAMQYGLYPKPEKPIVICDLDGTLCDISHRLPLVRNLPEGQKKDWKGFFDGLVNDTMRQEVADMLESYISKGHPIFFVSGRPDNYRAWTEDWLRRNFTIPPHTALFMRPAGDKRPDTDVKKEIYERYFKGKYPIEVVIDDRPSVIRMWEEEGLKVVDVGSGVEF